MQIKDIQRLIDNKFQPNVAEWAMDVEDILNEANMMSDEARKCLTCVKQQPLSWHQSFPEASDTLVATLKRVVKNMKTSIPTNMQEEKNPMSNYKYDVFLSHAHADKELFVADLKNSFEKLGIRIFYDTDSIKWGNNWKKKIYEGLDKCRFAVIVISDDFYGREWTEKELKTLLTRQNSNGEEVILPILYNTTLSDMQKHYKSLTGIQFLEVSDTCDIKDITILLAERLLDDYAKTVRNIESI
jgi:hypothetical protein